MRRALLILALLLPLGAYGQMAGGIMESQRQGNIRGTTTNNNATAGSVGEYVEALPGAVSTNTAADVNYGSVSLTAGDWDATCQISTTNGSTNTGLKVGLSTTSATFGATVGVNWVFAACNATAGVCAATHSQRLSLSATTTVYCVQRTFVANSLTNGVISARRVR